MDVSNITAKPAQYRPVRHSPRRLWRVLIEWLDAWAFADLDARARVQGWQIRRPAPLIRVYRSTAFDLYVRCPSCGGEGATNRGHCRGCLGSGRVTRDPFDGAADGVRPEPHSPHRVLLDEL